MVRLRFLGHSAWLIEGERVKLVIDPFITGNPLAPVSADELSVDYVIVTHAHSDHTGDAERIARRCSATIVANNELANFFGFNGLKNHPMHIGGSISFPDGLFVKLFPAFHGSAIIKNKQVLSLGLPTGVLIGLEGKYIYHAGDTGLFSDMKLVGRRNPVDVALLPIGGNFTMDEVDAATAAEFIHPKYAIPMHYNTFEVIKADPKQFVENLPEDIEGVIINPGEIFELKG